MIAAKMLCCGVAIGTLTIMAFVLLILPFTGILSAGASVVGVLAGIALLALVGSCEHAHVDGWPIFTGLMVTVGVLSYAILMLL